MTAVSHRCGEIDRMGKMLAFSLENELNLQLGKVGSPVFPLPLYSNNKMCF